MSEGILSYRPTPGSPTTSDADPAGRWRALAGWGGTLFLSAFLLFQVQPVLAKLILPWFGGAAAVWTTSLMFFQCAYLLGNLYAWWLMRRSPQVQSGVHIALLAASLLMLPILPRASWKPPADANPMLYILGVLATTVGLPFVILSATSPLLQAWYVRRREGARPYRVFAVSNAGSLLALLSYPILVEPHSTTRHQAIGWSAAYVLFGILCGASARRERQNTITSDRKAAKSRSLAEFIPAPLPGLGMTTENKTTAAHAAHPHWKLQLLWLALAADAAALLLAVTNHLSQNVAAVPMLWIVPLSLYLLSLILCFEGHGWYQRFFFLRLLAVALGGMAYALSPDFVNAGPLLQVPLFCVGLFVCCMVCHGELEKLKPAPEHLTLFYLLVSAGGALGGIFVGVIAPWQFRGFYELPLAVLGCAVLTLIALYRDPTFLPRKLPLPGTFAQSLPRKLPLPGTFARSLPRKLPLTCLLPKLALPATSAQKRTFAREPTTVMHRRWLHPVFLLAAGLTLALAVSLYREAARQGEGARVTGRNFYGVLRVSDLPATDKQPLRRQLVNGTIVHGIEILESARISQPTTYYGNESGAGIALLAARARGSLQVGVIGLGAGTLASYGQAGDRYFFYDINPLVIRTAQSQFAFLRDSKAEIQVVPGDARLSLERDAATQFDVLLVDAFSGDAIPIHLLTREAFELYLRHLRPHGVLALHVSNKYLDLEPVVRAAAGSLGLSTATVVNTADETNEIYTATWVLVARESSELPVQSPVIAWSKVPQKNPQPWTDDYSNLLEILR